MSSLDEVYQQMMQFRQALLEFDEEVRISAAGLDKAHQDITAMWSDEAAVRYQQAYEPLSLSLDQYVRGDAPRFEQFLDAKLRQLDRYLHGA